MNWEALKELWPITLVVGAALIRNERGHWKAKAGDKATNVRIDNALESFEAAMKADKEAMQAALARIGRGQEVAQADIKHLLERQR